MGGNPKKVHHCTYEGCKSSFNRPYRLEQHLFVHNNFKPYVCPEENCSKSYTNKSHFIRHMRKAHRRSPDKEIVYSCTTCMKKYTNRQNLKKHINNKHKSKNHFSCDICKLKFKKKFQLSGHMYKHTGVKAFSCDICGKKCITLTEKKRHRSFHKTYQCLHCLLFFDHWSKYQKHLKIDHYIKEYICDICKRSFKKRSHIVRHMTIHSATRAFACPYENCQRIYSRNSNLKQHVLMKHERVTHDCLICNAQLSSKKSLNEHIRKRHDSEPKMRVYITKSCGRKSRKDIGSFKGSTALKLAGKTKNTEKSEPIIEVPIQPEPIVQIQADPAVPIQSLPSFQMTEKPVFQIQSEQKVPIQLEPTIAEFQSDHTVQIEVA